MRHPKGQHPNSLRAWSHNALRGSAIRSHRSMRWLLNFIATNPSVHPETRRLAAQIDKMMNELIEGLRIRIDP